MAAQPNRKRTITWNVPNLGRDHDEDVDKCWCEVVTIYVSQATGRRLRLHRLNGGILPPAGSVAMAKQILDSPDMDMIEDHQ